MQPTPDTPVPVQHATPFHTTARVDAFDLLAVAEQGGVAAEWAIDYVRFSADSRP